MLPCESSRKCTPPLARNFYSEGCMPKYGLEHHWDGDNHLDRRDFARKTIDIREVFGVPCGHSSPVWRLAGTDALRDGDTEGLYRVIGGKLSRSEGLKPGLYLGDNVLLWEDREGDLD